MKAYSLDLRERVLKDCDAGMTTSAVAAKYSVSPAWVRRLKQRRRETGQVAPFAQRHGPRPAWQTHADRIRLAVEQAPDLTLREYIERFALPISKSALARALAALGLSRKKSRSRPASRNAPT
jgi:transposase